MDYQSQEGTTKKIKDLICKEMILTYKKKAKKKQTSIRVEASNKGLSAVLLQEGKPIAFAPKAL